jgi:cytochrome c
MTLAMLALPVLLVAVVGGSLVLRMGRDHPIDPRWWVPGGDPERGRQAIIQHGCGACHVIPGVRDATGRVGPRLNDFREQMYIGGQLANTPDNLIRWIQNPQHFAPNTAMPNLNIPESDARDITAYIYSDR